MQRVKKRHQARWRGVIQERKALHKARRAREGFFPAPSACLKSVEEDERGGVEPASGGIEAGAGAGDDVADGEAADGGADDVADGVADGQEAAVAAAEADPSGQGAVQEVAVCGVVPLARVSPSTRRALRGARRRAAAGATEAQLEPGADEAGAAPRTRGRSSPSDQYMSV